MLTSTLACRSLTAVVLIAVVVAVQVSVAAFAPQDAAARAALEVAGGALCRHGDKSPGQGQRSLALPLRLRRRASYRPHRPRGADRWRCRPPLGTGCSRSLPATAVPRCRAPTRTWLWHSDTTTCHNKAKESLYLNSRPNERRLKTNPH